MSDTRESENYFSKKVESEATMTDQMSASAYHLKPSEVKKLIIATNNFRDRCMIKALWWIGLRRKELTTHTSKGREGQEPIVWAVSSTGSLGPGCGIARPTPLPAL